MSKKTAASPPDTTSNPDSEYDYLKRIILMLELAVARIEYGMSDSHDPVAALTDSFTALAGGIKHIQTASQTLQDGGGKTTIEEECSAAEEKVHAAIVAFQFYDKLTQRLSHVSKSLVSLNALISDTHKYTDARAWQALHDEVRSRYTLDSDQAMLKALLAGQTLEEILQYTDKSTDADDVELF